MAARKTSRAGGATYLIGDIGGTNTRLAVRAEGRRDRKRGGNEGRRKGILH